MTTPALAYSVQDRSLLLPYYKRFLVEPLLPFIPASVNPTRTRSRTADTS